MTKIIENKEEEKENVSSHANISDTPFDQKSRVEGVLNCHTQTDMATL